MSIRYEARADVRALSRGLVFGAAIGLALGLAYLAGGAAHKADEHARVLRLAGAASLGFSETALRDEASRMDPGALAVAQNHDRFLAAGAAQRDRQAVMFLSQANARSAAEAGGPPLLRVGFPAPANPVARPFRFGGGALESARDLDCLADAVYYEARGETPAGQAAVAQVVLNRVRHPAFPKSVCGVVFQGAQAGDVCQFSFACDGSMTRPREPIAWRRAREVAAHALAGFVMPSVGNATHFHVVGLDPDWGPRLLRVAQVGLHVFYRFGGYAGAPGRFNAQPEHSAPGSEVSAHPIFASMIPLSGDTADGRPTAQYIVANATMAPDVAAKPTAGAPPSASAAPDAGAAAAPSHPATGSGDHLDPASKSKTDAAAKPETTAAAGKSGVQAAS